MAALAHAGEYRSQIDLLVSVRNDLVGRLAELSWIQPVPSDANFLLCQINGSDGAADLGGAALRDALGREGVFVRYFDSPERLRGYVRISVPHPDQLDELLERLQRAAMEAGLV